MPAARYVSDRTLAELLDCSTSTIWRRVADGTLPPPIKVGGLTRFDPDAALTAFAASDRLRSAAKRVEA